MKLLIVIAAIALPLAADNSARIQDESGAGCANCTYKISRYFAEGEIANYPRPRIGGSPAAYWQAHVRTRWSGGSVRFAVLYVEASLPANGSLTVDFVNDANQNSGGSAMTSQQMLDFDAGGGAGSWGCKIETVSGGTSLGASCRTMLSSGHYRVLEDGPLATTVLIREGPDTVADGFTRDYSFGYQCTANCTAPYAASTWAAAPNATHESMRPSFIVTFYRRWSKVRTHYLLDNGWADRLQDQRIRLRLYNGGSETNPVSDSSGEFFFPARARAFEEYWELAPNAYSMDLNTQYMESTGVIPEFGPRTISEQAVALEKAAFDASDKGASLSTAGGNSPYGMGTGQWALDMSAGSGRPDLGLFPRWDARLLNSWHKDLWTVSKGNAKAMMHTPIFVLEHNSAGNYCSSSDCDLGGGTISAFGRPVSIDARPTFTASHNVSAADDLPTPVGAVTRSNDGRKSSMCWPWTATAKDVGNDWIMELQHIPEVFFVQYLTTGDYVYLEALQAWANNVMLRHLGGSGLKSYDRWGATGFINGPTQRDFAWGLRTLAHAAVMSSDGTPESFYFREKFGHNLAYQEGVYQITDGQHYPAGGEAECVATPSALNGETEEWCISHKYCQSDKDNPLGFVRNLEIPESTTDNSNGSNAGYSTALWQDAYCLISYTHLAQLDENWKPIAEAHAEFLVKLVQDTDMAKPYLTTTYHFPIQDGNRNFYQTMDELWAALVKDAKLARDLDESSGYVYYAGVGGTYTLRPTYYQVLSVGSEHIRVNADPEYYNRTNCAVSASTDEANCGGQSIWQDGDLLMLKADTLPSASPALSQGDTFYVDLLPDGVSVDLYTDEAMTQPVDFTQNGTIKLGMLRLRNSGRGYGDTDPAAHSQGDSLAWADYQWGAGGVWHQYDIIYLAALGAASSLDVSWVDEGNGATVYTPRDAYAAYKALIPQSVLNRLGSNSDCAALGLSVAECDNPQWGFYESAPPNPGGPAISTTRLPSGVVGNLYSQTLSSTAGMPPYNWAVTSGTMCDGLVLSSDGIISGTPLTGEQRCTFAVQVTDSVGATDARLLSITVREVPPRSNSVRFPPGSVSWPRH